MHTITTLDELTEEAKTFLATIKPAKGGATLVTLSGVLGAGKTALVKSVAKELGIVEDITSPTFVLEKIYSLPEGGVFKRLVHIDAYRLPEGANLAPLGFDELMQDSGNLILLEWPEQAFGHLPEPTAKITLSPNADGTRTIDIIYD